MLPNIGELAMCLSKHDALHPREVICADRSLELLWQTIKRHLATGLSFLFLDIR